MNIIVVVSFAPECAQIPNDKMGAFAYHDDFVLQVMLQSYFLRVLPVIRHNNVVLWHPYLSFPFSHQECIALY